jgi:hypothetical protein
MSTVRKCGNCGEPGHNRRSCPVSEVTPTVENMDDTTKTEADAFADPATPKQTAADAFADPSPARVPTDSSGDRTYKGRYLVKDPRTGLHVTYKNGKPRGFTRVSTVIKAATDGFAISQWGKHNVLIGAAMKPSVAARAYGLKNKGGPDGDWGRLVDLVEELSTVAGAKDASRRGTDIHSWAEKVDGGLPLESVPPVYREMIEQYREELDKRGLEPVPSLMERTTMVTEFDGVAGTFDRILFHRPSGTYLIADLKSGKDLDHGSDEIEGQLSLYARGVNQNGIYDWDADGWTRLYESGGEDVNLPRVREDVGIVIHMPAEGKYAGTVRLFPADLKRGWSYVEECHRVRELRAAKPRWSEWDGTLPVDGNVQEPPAGPPWDKWFSECTTDAEASNLWRQAKNAGIRGVELNRLVRLAQDSIRLVSQVDMGS